MSAPPPPNPDAPFTGAARSVNREGLISIVWTCFTVATFFVSLRLFVRWHQNRRFLADDYWITWAWLCTLTMAILQTEQTNSLWYMTNLQTGRIAYDPEELLRQRSQLTRWQFPIIKMFWIILWSVKASFLALFYRLVQPFPIIRRCWYGVSVFAVLALAVSIICSALTCSPPSDYFHGRSNSPLPKPRLISNSFALGSCDSPQEQWRQSFNVIFSTTVDVTTDIMIMALPIAVLPSLQLDKKKKIGLGIAFSLGIIIICVAIVRMSQVIVGKKVDLVGLAIWGAVETATALVVGSLPALKGLLTRGIKKYTTSRSGRTDPADYDSRSSQRRRGHGSAMTPRAIVVSDCIPLDDLHHSGQVDGGIYVHKTFTTATERDDNSSQGEGDEAAILSNVGDTIHCNDLKWLPLAPKIWIKLIKLTPEKGSYTVMIRAEPGGVLPRHRHVKSAEIYILKGSGDHPQAGHFEKGDYVSEHEGAHHDPLVFEVETEMLMISEGASVFVDDEGNDLYAMDIPMLQNLAASMP
ncbi:hypothetical protein IL306_014148 [Fusarium sp. DS 682]|nr:hypothetical protein IL306_014148 [Fusarium sp. DS 682]